MKPIKWLNTITVKLNIPEGFETGNTIPVKKRLVCLIKYTAKTPAIIRP
jgi:hypothetical protein